MGVRDRISGVVSFWKARPISTSQLRHAAGVFRGDSKQAKTGTVYPMIISLFKYRVKCFTGTKFDRVEEGLNTASHVRDELLLQACATTDDLLLTRPVSAALLLSSLSSEIILGIRFAFCGLVSEESFEICWPLLRRTLTV